MLLKVENVSFFISNLMKLFLSVTVLDGYLIRSNNLYSTVTVRHQLSVDAKRSCVNDDFVLVLLGNVFIFVFVAKTSVRCGFKTFSLRWNAGLRYYD